MSQPVKEKLSAEISLQRRVRKLEWACSILGISVILLGVFGIKQAVALSKCLEILKNTMDEIAFIIQQAL